MGELIGGIALIAWAVIGLFVATAVEGLARTAFAKPPWQAFGYTLLVFWGIVPLGLMVVAKVQEHRIEQQLEDLGKEYAALCADPNRVKIARTVQGVNEVAIWPSTGPRDGWGNDLFFPARTPAEKWVVAREGGRYGGFRRAVLLDPRAKHSDAPQYQVVFQEVKAGLRNEESFIAGALIRIVDRQTGDILAERSDYVRRGNFGLPHGCDAKESGPSSEWSEGNLAFIHNVLNPTPGVPIPREELAYLPSMRIEEALPLMVRAELIDERPGTSSSTPSPSIRLPRTIRYEAMQRTGMSRNGLMDYGLTFALPDRDVLMVQGIGERGNLIAFSEDEDGYVALFWIDDREHLLLRRFSRIGDLRAQARVLLPNSIRPVEYVDSPTRYIESDKGRYFVVVGINPGDGKFAKNALIAIPRMRKEPKKK